MRPFYSTLLIYAVLLWLGRDTLLGLAQDDAYYPALMYDSGVWSIRWLIVAISVTPLLRLITLLGRGQALGRWLLRKRRHIGLVSAIFAVVHLLHYLRHEGRLDAVLHDLWLLEYATGWLSLALIAALAVTSHAWAVRAMGRRWKRLHLWVYPAGILALWHWYLLDYYTGRVLFWSCLFAAPPLLRWMFLRIRHAA